ncbi:hypothetical protein KM043_002090 [Ampulex compressa]|nr:hypothetical protein KM043_002090 [Ampulex compressa]
MHPYTQSLINPYRLHEKRKKRTIRYTQLQAASLLASALRQKITKGSSRSYRVLGIIKGTEGVLSKEAPSRSRSPRRCPQRRRTEGGFVLWERGGVSNRSAVASLSREEGARRVAGRYRVAGGAKRPAGLLLISAITVPVFCQIDAGLILSVRVAARLAFAEDDSSPGNWRIVRNRRRGLRAHSISSQKEEKKGGTVK